MPKGHYKRVGKPRGPYKVNMPVVVDNTPPAQSYIIRKSLMERPPAVYTNSPSPFGLADELHGKILKR